MKLIIQIPCYNEAATLPVTLAALPREVTGVEQVEVLVVDDGSSDGTAQVARELGVPHIVRFSVHRGLAAAFAAGLDAALRLGADVIVNTDADNQYRGEDLPRLVEPILAGRADMVVGERTGAGVEEFSRVKRHLQRAGTWMVQRLSGTRIQDATSGFRALSREAAMRLHLFTDFTYTLETLIQAGKKNLAVASVPVRTNRSLRASRLFRSIPQYIVRSVQSMLRIYVIYQPLRALAPVGLVLVLGGSAGIGRFLIHYVTSGGAGKIQSLLLSAALLVMGFVGILVALLADLIGANRQLLEDVLYRLRRLEGRGFASTPAPAEARADPPPPEAGPGGNPGPRAGC